MAYTQADDAALFRRIIACGAELVNLDHPETWLQVAPSSGGAGR